MNAAIELHRVQGLHEVDGLPDWALYTARGLLFLLAVLLAAGCWGIVAAGVAERTYNWALLGIMALAVRQILVQIEAWGQPFTLEGLPITVVVFSVLAGSLAKRWSRRDQAR